MLLQGPAQIPIGDQSLQLIRGHRVLHPGGSSGGAGQSAHHFSKRSAFLQSRPLLNRHHQLGYGQGELTAQRTGWMIHGKIP